jgi:hypothetical protein
VGVATQLSTGSIPDVRPYNMLTKDAVTSDMQLTLLDGSFEPAYPEKEEKIERNKSGVSHEFA